VLVIALILGMLVVPGVSAQNNVKNEIDIEDAEAVASYYVQYVPTFLEGLDEWKDAR
jgi:ferritin-like protein